MTVTAVSVEMGIALAQVWPESTLAASAAVHAGSAGVSCQGSRATVQTRLRPVLVGPIEEVHAIIELDRSVRGGPSNDVVGS